MRPRVWNVCSLPHLTTLPYSQLQRKKHDSNENFDCASWSVQRLCLYMHSELVPSRHAWTSGWLRLLTRASKLLVVSTRGQDARNRLGQSCTYTCACTGATYKLAIASADFDLGNESTPEVCRVETVLAQGPIISMPSRPLTST